MRPIVKAVRAALDETWRTPRELAAIMDCWAPISIRKELMQLARDGEIEIKTEPFANNFRHLYRAKAK